MTDLIQWKKGAKYWTRCYNPIIGCEKISEACENCYAERIVLKFEINGQLFEPREMIKAKAPQSGVVFVGNMTDLLGKWNSREDVWNYLSKLNVNAINLILTKRSYRLKELATYNHWIGITCENQARADERMMDLLRYNIPHRWLSLEPLLSPVNIRSAYDYKLMERYYCSHCGFWGDCANTYRCTNCGEEENVECRKPCPHCGDEEFIEDICPKCGTYPSSASGEYYGTLESYRESEFPMPGINWVVVGAESGTNRRECKLEWVESIVEQCQAASVPVFVKQLDIAGKLVTDISKFPEHLQIRQVPWAGR